MNLKKMQADLNFISKYEAVLYGSHVDGTAHSKSDIDVAIITRNPNKKENIALFKDVLGKAPPIYDVRIFELLPLKIQISIADNFTTIFGDALELSEYFYFYRKLWEDAKFRIEKYQFNSFREKIKAISRAKRLFIT